MFSSHTLLCASPAANASLQTAAGGALEKQKKNKRKTQKQLSLLSAELILSVSLVFAYALACLIERSVNLMQRTSLLASRVSFFYFFFRPNVFRGGSNRFGCEISPGLGTDSPAAGLRQPTPSSMTISGNCKKYKLRPVQTKATRSEGFFVTLDTHQHEVEQIPHQTVHLCL